MDGSFARRLLGLVLLVCAGIALRPSPHVVAAESEVQLIEKKVIGDRAPHNAFTDLIRFKDRWYCIFREGQGHVSPDGRLRILVSADGDSWKSAALLSHEEGDLRDGKLSATPDGRLMVNGAVAFHKPKDGHTHQSLVWFSTDAEDWSEAYPICDPNVWLWRVTWNQGTCYGMGYSTAQPRFLRLYSSTDGRNFETSISDLKVPSQYPNESSIVFLPDGEALCLLRQDPGPALLGRAKSPYDNWSWKSLGQPIGGPQMVRLPDGRLLAGVRLPQGVTRTSLCWVEPEAGTLNECLELARSGDQSYPGLVFDDGVLWMSYYIGPGISSAKVYIAKVKIPSLENAIQKAGN